MSTAFLARALEVARAAAAAADAVVSHYWKAGAAVEIKPDQTPVTVADVEAERAIKAVLRASFPDHGFYGEEEGREHADREWLWLIDPIDGTKSFVRGYPMFSTQIALMHQGELVLGVSSAVAYGQCAWAARGLGAFMDGRPIQVSTIDSIERAALSTGNIKSLAAGPRWSRMPELLTRANRTRGYGDFLHYHLLAAGQIELVIESDVNILDIAALAVIVREAGGVFSDLDGRELDLDTRSVLAGNPAMHALAMGVLNP